MELLHCAWLQAAERFRCSSLVYVHRTEFLLHGGDRRWLTSSDGRLPWHVPLKLHNLQELNKILAHRPWALNPSLISVSVAFSALTPLLLSVAFLDPSRFNTVVARHWSSAVLYFLKTFYYLTYR